MTISNDNARQLRLSHVELYVENLERALVDWNQRYGFVVVGGAEDHPEARSVMLRQGSIGVVLTEGTSDGHPASRYVQAHGDGVADIALVTDDLQQTLDLLSGRGARILQDPEPVLGEDGATRAVIAGFGDIVHSITQRGALASREGQATLPPGFMAASDGRRGDSSPTSVAADDLVGLDHVAVCVEAGELAATVDYYVRILGFANILEERIAVGRQAMNSTVVRNPAGDVTLVVIEPDPSLEPGQIDDFLVGHGGPGVQHLAFETDDAVRAVHALSTRGVTFLATPRTYYDLLSSRVSLLRHDLAALRETNILVDSDHAGQLFQIFARSTHRRRTFFIEIIERIGAQSFGSANIKALYESIERERLEMFQAGRAEAVE